MGQGSNAFNPDSLVDQRCSILAFWWVKAVQSCHVNRLRGGATTTLHKSFPHTMTEFAPTTTRNILSLRQKIINHDRLKSGSPRQKEGAVESKGARYFSFCEEGRSSKLAPFGSARVREEAGRLREKAGTGRLREEAR